MSRTAVVDKPVCCQVLAVVSAHRVHGASPRARARLFYGAPASRGGGVALPARPVLTPRFHPPALLFRYCFSNQMSSMTTKLVVFHLNVGTARSADNDEHGKLRSARSRCPPRFGPCLLACTPGALGCWAAVCNTYAPSPTKRAAARRAVLRSC